MEAFFNASSGLVKGDINAFAFASAIPSVREGEVPRVSSPTPVLLIPEGDVQNRKTDSNWHVAPHIVCPTSRSFCSIKVI